MDFINYINLEPAFGWGEINLLSEISNVIHTGVGRSVNLNQVEVSPFVDGDTWRAFVTRSLGKILILAIGGLGDKPG
jgi:hypothetical protein